MLKVGPTHARYLAAQRGGASDYAGDLRRFTFAYNETLNLDFETLWFGLPERISTLLDIGSGLGGIDIYLQRHFGCAAHLLDGVNDSPDATDYADGKSFNSEAVTRDFWAANDARLTRYHNPAQLKPFRCDVILSLFSWCFHFPPVAYLEFVRACCHRDTVLITDVRKAKTDWLADLEKYFQQTLVLWRREKFDRIAWRLK